MWLYCFGLLFGCDPVLFAPPITVEHESRFWRFGVDVETSEVRKTILTAIRADGTSANREVLLEKQGRRTNRDTTRVVPEPFPEELRAEGGCVGAASERLVDFRYIGVDKIAGYAVERFRGKARSSDSTQEADIAFAPGLHCATLEHIVKSDSWHPAGGSMWVERVTSIRLGEPDPRLFTVRPR